MERISYLKQIENCTDSSVCETKFPTASHARESPLLCVYIVIKSGMMRRHSTHPQSAKPSDPDGTKPPSGGSFTLVFFLKLKFMAFFRSSIKQS